MTLNGNKLTAAVFILSASMASADINTPEIITFSSGTPAIAADVNNNFNGLKAYSVSLEALIESQAALITALETKTTALESESSILDQKISNLENAGASDDFSIKVYGDEVLIGYTDGIPDIAIGGSMLLKTTLGTVKLKGDYSDGYQLGYYNKMNPTAENFGGPNYSDAVCSSMIFAVSPGEGNPIIFTEIAGVVDTDQIFVGENTSWLIEAGSEFNRNNTSFYYKNGDSCEEATWFSEGTISIPMVELNPETHGIKHTYSTISIEGYVLN